MSRFEPKLLYCPVKHGEIPVWEVTSHNGSKIYYERLRYDGLRPIGVLSSSKLGKTTIEEYDVVKTTRGYTPKVLKAKDGYVVPMSWYEKDPFYDGPSDAVVGLEEREA